MTGEHTQALVELLGTLHGLLNQALESSNSLLIRLLVLA